VLKRCYNFDTYLQEYFDKIMCKLSANRIARLFTPILELAQLLANEKLSRDNLNSVNLDMSLN